MKAMVLCAGFGTRLGEFTREIPKPMLPLEEHPLVEYIVCHLVRHGFDEIAMNLHFMPEVIPGYFGDGARWGCHIRYVCEPQLLGTAGGVKNLADFLAAGGPFLVQYGDMITNQDLTAMLAFHRSRRALATVLVHERRASNSIACLDAEGRIVRFLERPTEEERRGVESPWVFSGVTICEPELLDAIPPGVACDLPRDVFIKLALTGRLFAFPLTGRRCAVDSPARLAEARESARAGEYRL